ncbi:transposase [Flavobacterium aquiphilum]|uniref:transposase n=1 Tax=Flavobacterium aquiphilum TaxID=3003261 RepID=UPI0024812602|nr:transposase [Flavobacterium aquiphilum]
MPLFKNKYRTESNRLKNWDYSSKAIYFITLVTQNRKCIFGDIVNKKMVLNDNGKIIKNELLKSIEIRDRWLFHNWVIMPNHIHLLIEIVSTTENVENHNVENHPVETHCSASLQSKSQSQNQFPKFNCSTKRILPIDTDIELVKAFVSYDAYLSYIKSTNDVVRMHNVKTHCSASLHDTPQHNPSQQKDGSKMNLLIKRPNSISSFVAVFKSITTKQIKYSLGNIESDSIWQSNYHDHIIQNYDSFDKIYYYIKNNPKNWENDSINPQLQ